MNTVCTESVISSVLYAVGYSGRVAWPDVNFPAWKRGLKAKVSEDPVIRKAIGKVMDAAASSGGSGVLASAIHTHLGREWAFDVYMLAELVREGGTWEN